MAECGCLQQSAKKVITEVLDTYLSVINDNDLKNDIITIKNDIETCKCEASKQKEVKKQDLVEKPKRAPSEYNKYTSICMKSGKSMKECAIEWKGKKKL